MEQQLLRTCNALYAYSKIVSKENLKDALIEQYECSLQKTKDFLKEEYNLTNTRGQARGFSPRIYDKVQDKR